MSEQDTVPSTSPSRRSRRRLGRLIGLLLVAIAALVASRAGFGLRLGPREKTILDDPFVNKEILLSYLDGQKIQPLKAVDPGGNPTDWLIVKKEQIENLELMSDDPQQVSFRFTINDGRRHHAVEGSVLVFHSDSPELHYHDYRFFTASVVREY